MSLLHTHFLLAYVPHHNSTYMTIKHPSTPPTHSTMPPRHRSQNPFPKDEDAGFFCVLDGHGYGGEGVSQYASKR